MLRIFKKGLPDTATAPFCPSEVQGSVFIDPNMPWLKRFMTSAGMGMMIAVGYMDPGNWATDIQAGSLFGYKLLFVVLASSLFAVYLQALCIRLGLQTQKDLAVHCREQFSKRWNYFFWLLAELAIISCDVAEVLGTALALHLLFHITLTHGLWWTAVDTLIVLALQGRGMRRLEAIILGLVSTVGICYFVEIYISQPVWSEVWSGFLPGGELLHSTEAWVLAVGILGATVMPHNLYLQSSLIQTRKTVPGEKGKIDLYRLALTDNAVSLFFAFLINAAILILSGTLFFKIGHEVAEIQDAHRLLSPLVGVSAAGVLFALALFASGQSSTITGTIAGQVVLEGFLELKIPCWQRRLITRALALLPAIICIRIFGEGALGKILVWSQVILSLQLPFAMGPLLVFAGSKKIMGEWRIGNLSKVTGWAIATVVLVANIWMLATL